MVKLYGPTNFEPVIRHIADIAKECRKRAYHVLLILTDGDITDKQQTITALVEASELPLSVIIVGVGDEDFEDMAILDGDDGGLVDENGKRAKHDIVQFVAFKKCRNAELLAAEVRAAPPCPTLPSPLCPLQSALAEAPFSGAGGAPCTASGLYGHAKQDA